MSSREHTLAVFLEFTGAFDNINCDMMATKLALLGLLINIVKFVKFLLYERKIESIYSQEIRHIYNSVH